MHENNHSIRKNDDDDDPSNFSIFLQGLDYFPRWDLKRPHCGKIRIFVQKLSKKVGLELFENNSIENLGIKTWFYRLEIENWLRILDL